MPRTPEYAADIVPRRSASHLRVATFNCENLFARPIAMNLEDSRPLLVMANHFTSQGSDRNGLRRKLPQSRRVSEILDDRMQQGFTHLIVAVDLNDGPPSAGSRHPASRTRSRGSRARSIRRSGGLAPTRTASSSSIIC